MEGIEIFLQGDQRDLDEAANDDDDEGALLIDGEQPEEVRTIFVDKLPENFERDCLNALAVAKAFDWQQIIEWKKREEDFTHEDVELGAIVTAEGGMKQIFTKKPKVT